MRIEHIGSAHNDKEEAVLISLARQKLHQNQLPLFKSIKSSPTLILKSSSSSLLHRVLLEEYDQLGFGVLADEIFALLCVARIVEPSSKLDSLRVLS